MGLVHQTHWTPFVPSICPPSIPGTGLQSNLMPINGLNIPPLLGPLFSSTGRIGELIGPFMGQFSHSQMGLDNPWGQEGQPIIGYPGWLIPDSRCLPEQNKKAYSCALFLAGWKGRAEPARGAVSFVAFQRLSRPLPTALNGRRRL